MSSKPEIHHWKALQSCVMSIPCNVTSCRSRNSCTELQTLPRERETWWQNMKHVLIIINMGLSWFVLKYGPHWSPIFFSGLSSFSLVMWLFGVMFIHFQTDKQTHLLRPVAIDFLWRPPCFFAGFDSPGDLGSRPAWDFCWTMGYPQIWWLIIFSILKMI